jgi:hypothetical protein
MTHNQEININIEEAFECCICFENIGEKNNCVTPCGHKFCFECMVKSLSRNNSCPCCRTVLQEEPEDQEDDDDDDEEDDDDYEDDEEEDDGTKHAGPAKIASELEKLGYNMTDVIALWLGRYDNTPRYEPLTKYTSQYIEKFSNELDEIIERSDIEATKEYNERHAFMEEDGLRKTVRTRSIFLDTDDYYILNNLFNIE